MNTKQKQHWLTVMKGHTQADRFVQGTWLAGQDDSGVFRGCFFGYAMQTDNNALTKAADSMGLPYELVYLAERIFEGLPIEDAKDWPVQLLEAIPVDTDLSNIKHAVAVKRMERLLEMHKDLGKKYGLLYALKRTIEYHKNPTESARSAAWSIERDALLEVLAC